MARQRDRESGPIIGRHHLIVNEYDFPRIRAFPRQAVESEEAATWTELAERNRTHRDVGVRELPGIAAANLNSHQTSEDDSDLARRSQPRRRPSETPGRPRGTHHTRGSVHLDR